MYRTVTQLDFLLSLTSQFFPNLCTRVEMPNRSIQGRPIYALHIHAGSSTRSVLIIGGMHARELMNPEAIAELALELVAAYFGGEGISLGGKSWSATDIKTILESFDIWMLPCANPDGREFVMTVDHLWRKNRRDNPGTTCDGVDVNRNCDFMWGVITSQTSCSPCQLTYLGPDRFSEPEARNIKDFCDTHSVELFLDVHSFSELVLFPWGHAFTQTTNPSQNFLSLATGTCASINPSSHTEFMPANDLQRFQSDAQRVVDDIRAVRGRNYTPESIRDLAANTGTSTDYVYSRHISNSALDKTFAYAFETGPPVLFPNGSLNEPESFHPANPTLIIQDTKAGIISLMQRSVCAVELFSTTVTGSESGLEKMRAIRDEQLAKTDAGRELVALFERVQFELLGLVLADESLTKEAMELVETSFKLLEQEETVLSTREVERGLAFIDSLASRTTSKELLIDLDTIRKQLKASTDKSFAKILDELAATSAPAVAKKTKPRRKK
jgi:murein tripeptide amidase MpaA